MLLLLFFRSLVRLASLSSLFSIWARVAVFSMDITPRWSRGALPSLAALGLVARRSPASPGARVIRSCSMGGLALPYPRPSPLHVRGVQERFISQSLTLLLLGRTGWY